MVVVAVRAAGGDAELVADELFALGASAVGEQAPDPAADPAGGAAEPDGAVELVADLPVEALAGLRHPYRLVPVTGDVADGWRTHARTVVAGRFVLRPVWCDEAGEGAAEPRIEVLLDPGGAFGSGSHPTTRACVELLDDPVVRAELAAGVGVLDVGSGSGVLSVAAALAGAPTVTAVDVDPEARRATTRAAELNGVSDRVRVVDGSLESVADEVRRDGRSGFGLVLANLLVPVVEELAGWIVAACPDGAVLVVGGLLGHHVERAVGAVAEAAAATGGRVEVVRERRDGEWRTLVLRWTARTG